MLRKIAVVLVSALLCAVTASAADRGPWYVVGRGVGGGNTGSPPPPPPPSGIPIQTTDNAQTVINANTACLPTCTFVIKAGIHRQQTFTPRTGDTFIGEAGAIFNGAKVITGATGSGPWVFGGQTQVEPAPLDGGGMACQGIYYGTDAYYPVAHPACAYPFDLFFDSAWKERTLTACSTSCAGKWFFDYNADTITVYDNPSGHVVETSLTPAAVLTGSATGVTIDNVIFEKYAAPTQQSAVYLGSGWVFKNSESRYNHSTGIFQGSNSSVLNSKLRYNGQQGITGEGTTILADSNEIAYNNQAFYDPWWEAGGTKWARVNGLTVTNNWSHNNFGPGLWTDINNINVTYQGNLIENNQRAGIMHEISYAATISGNIINGNGNFRYYARDGCVLVIDSPNVTVSGNTCTDNYAGIIGGEDERRPSSGPDVWYGPWTLSNLEVKNNVINSLTPLGLATPNGVFTQYDAFSQMTYGNTVWTSNNNRWHDNTYHLNEYGYPSYSAYFNWSNANISLAQWQGSPTFFDTGATGGGGGTTVSSDDFNRTNGVNLTASPGATGATYAKQTGQTGDFVIAGGARARLNSVATGAVYYASGTPSTSTSTSSIDFVINTTISDNYYALWCNMGTGASTGYMVQWGGGSLWTLNRIDAGFATTPLDSAAATYPNGTTVHVVLSCSPSLKTANIGGGAITLSTTDTAQTATGHGGFSSYASTVAPTDSTGVHFDNFLVTE